MKRAPVLTRAIAMAMARDAGDRSMVRGKRGKWARKDHAVACATFAKLYAIIAAESAEVANVAE